MLILVACGTNYMPHELSDQLENTGHPIIYSNTHEQTVKICRTERPDLVIFDSELEDTQEIECLRAIRSIKKNDWMPIICVSTTIDDDYILQALELGVDDYLSKPLSNIALTAKLKIMQHITDLRWKLTEIQAQINQLPAIDQLTGLYNQLQFDKNLCEKIAHVNRHKCILAILVLDLNKFQKINDNYGHHIGDLILAGVGKRLMSYLRTSDFIARINEDKFAIILNELDQSDVAIKVAQKIIDILSEPFNLSSYKICVTCSIGIIHYPYMNVDAHTAFNYAELAMSSAKQSGFNNYQLFNPAVHLAHTEAVKTIK